MLNRYGRASLSAALLDHDCKPLIDRVFAAGPAPSEPLPTDAEALFGAKHAAPTLPQRRPAALFGGFASAAARPAAKPQKLSLRLTDEQRWRLRLAAAFVRQPCQAFVVDALERQLQRLARDPACGGLGARLAGVSARNG